MDQEHNNRNVKSDKYQGNELILLNQRAYDLNKSKTKTVAVGLSPKHDLKPVVKITGVKHHQCVVFSHRDWESFLKNQGLMTNYFITPDEFWHPIVGKMFTIDFTTYNGVKIIKVHTGKDLEVLLGYESLRCLWDLLPLIGYKIEMLESQQFDAYYNNIVKNRNSDLFGPSTSSSVVNQTNQDNENVYAMMEMMQYYPDRIVADSNSGQLWIPNNAL